MEADLLSHFFQTAPPTLDDVAFEAGVSPSTASRVLNGKVKVSTAKENAVRKAVEKLDYHPNSAARLLATKRPSMVAILTHNTVRYGYAKTIEGIGAAASAAGHSIMIVTVESDSREHITSAISLVMAQSVSGIILVDFDTVTRKTLSLLPPTTKTVIAGGQLEDGGDAPRVCIDDTTTGAQATRHLLDLGHSTVHLMAIPTTDQAYGRVVGWRRALKDAQIPISQIIECNYDSQSGYEKAKELFEHPGVTAVICGNDEVALGVVAYAADHDIKIPEELSIVSFDDQPFAKFVRPPLTTVRQDFVALGRAAFTTLQQILDHGPVPRFATYDGDLIVRQSTGPKLA